MLKILIFFGDNYVFVMDILETKGVYRYSRLPEQILCDIKEGRVSLSQCYDLEDAKKLIEQKVGYNRFYKSHLDFDFLNCVNKMAKI